MIYPHREAAKQACEELNEKIQALLEQYDAYEECDDSCCATYLVVKYYNEEGKEKKYCH